MWPLSSRGGGGEGHRGQAPKKRTFFAASLTWFAKNKMMNDQKPDTQYFFKINFKNIIKKEHNWYGSVTFDGHVEPNLNQGCKFEETWGSFPASLKDKNWCGWLPPAGRDKQCYKGFASPPSPHIQCPVLSGEPQPSVVNYLGTNTQYSIHASWCLEILPETITSFYKCRNGFRPMRLLICQEIPTFLIQLFSLLNLNGL